MTKVRFAPALCAVIAASALFACSSDGATTDDLGVSQDLLVVSSGFEKDVTVFDDRLELPRAGHEDVLATKAGKLLVGGPSHIDRNARGFLRRAGGVRVVGDKIVVDTAKPLLTDVFQGNAQMQVADADSTAPMSAAGELRPAGWASKLGGALKLPVQLGLMSFVASLVDPVRSNEKFDVKVSLAGGSISFTPKVSTEVQVKRGELEHLVVQAEGLMVGDAEIDIDVKAKGTLESSKRGLLQPMHFDRRLVEWRPAHSLQFIGPVPVWETLELALVLRCDLAFNGEATGKVFLKAAVDGTYGAEYRKGDGWRKIEKGPTLDPSGSRLEVDQIGSADVKCSLEPQVALLVYDLAGPTLAMGPYANVHVDEATRAWSLQPGFRADVGVLIAFAKYQVANERFNILDVPLGSPLTGTY